MASLREIRIKIKSVRQTQKVTKAMKMIAAARLKKAQGALLSSRPYAYKVEELIKELSARLQAENRPLPALMRKRAEAKDKILVLFSSDRGLCGAYNVNLLKLAMDFHKKTQASGGKVFYFVIGKKGRDFLVRNGFPVEREYLNYTRKPTFAQGDTLAKEVVEFYQANTNIGEAAILYMDFKSLIKQSPALIPVIPVRAPENKKSAPVFDFIYEPGREKILEVLVPRYISVQFARTLHEAFTSEQASRMNVMENATRNAGELIDDLTLVGNKVRQANITREILEVVSGAEALVA